MIPDNTVDRYYYIFDAQACRTLVMDRMTGDEYAWDETSRAQLLDYAQHRCSTAVRRHFARWCVRQTEVDTAPLHTMTGRLWAAVRRGSHSTTRARVRTEAMDDAAVAAALGLPQGRSDAAQLLAVHACTHPDPRRAALDAAHMSERWAEFEADPDAATGVERVRQRHVDWLLDAIRTDGIPQ